VSDVLVIGEALIDVVTDASGVTSEHVGGSPANVAVALARLDRPVRIATAFGHDERGRRIGEHLAMAGVRILGDPRILERTSTAIATIAPTARPATSSTSSGASVRSSSARRGRSTSDRSAPSSHREPTTSYAWCATYRPRCSCRTT
jgi:sugar/nucleoside kinase (ribokinase family)